MPEQPEAWEPAGADYTSDRAFTSFPLSNDVLTGIQELGYKLATAVQAASIEPALAGRHLLVRAKTGTGKTAAFGIPVVEATPSGTRQPRALILAPTRELAMQIADEVAAIARYRDVAVAVLYGGVALGPQEATLQQGAAIVVGTPGRVLDHLRRGSLSLAECRMAVLDEADEMLSMGFFEDVTAILDRTHRERQVLLFSATISDETQRLADRYLVEPEQIRLSTDTDQVGNIAHVLYETTTEFHKARSLLYLLDLENPTSAIIFCNTREDTATVATFLDRQGLDAQLLSGELTQARRSEVMKRVKAGEVRFLVSTDVASRGIDISDLSHVINYALPPDPSVYLHRIGRTGRIGKRGTAISLVGGADLSTRRTLESVHQIPFEVRALPDAEAAVRMRVDRQIEQIRGAMGTLVFESLMPLARALRERADGDVLVAAALRAFFQWDRTRRASATDLPDPGTALREARGEARSDRPARDERPGDRRKDRRDRDRDRDRGRKRPERATRAPIASADLDALLVAEEAPGPVLEVSVGAEAGVAPTAPAEGEAGRKKRRRRRKKKGEGAAGAAGPGEGSDGGNDHAGDDLDALLSMDG
jgi:ATP-dependent RNA helicase DeaD